MATLSYTTLSGIFDSIGARAQLLKGIINSGFSLPFANQFYPRIHNSVGQGDIQVEYPLINSASALDRNTISGSLFKSIFTSFIQDLTAQVQNSNAGSSTFDQYISVSGPNISPDAEDVVYQCLNSHLSSFNVYFNKANILVAQYQATASGAGTFTAQTAVGDGVSAASAAGINYAPAKFILVPVQAVTSNIQLNLQLKKLTPGGGSLTNDFANIYFPSGAVSGLQITVNCGSGKTSFMYENCTNIVGAGGSNNDVFNVYAIMERAVSL